MSRIRVAPSWRPNTSPPSARQTCRGAGIMWSTSNDAQAANSACRSHPQVDLPFILGEPCPAPIICRRFIRSGQGHFVAFTPYLDPKPLSTSKTSLGPRSNTGGYKCEKLGGFPIRPPTQKTEYEPSPQETKGLPAAHAKMRKDLTQGYL